MSRALRRHRTSVARYKRIRLLYAHNLITPRTDAAGEYARIYLPYRRYGWQHWLYQPPHKWMMREAPMAWIREMMTRPARARSKHLTRLSVRGVDTEGWVFPDYKKPFIYFW